MKDRITKTDLQDFHLKDIENALHGLITEDAATYHYGKHGRKNKYLVDRNGMSKYRSEKALANSDSVYIADLHDKIFAPSIQRRIEIPKDNSQLRMLVDFDEPKRVGGYLLREVLEDPLIDCMSIGQFGISGYALEKIYHKANRTSPEEKHQIACMAREVRKSILKGYCFGLSIDLKNAFGNISIEILHWALENIMTPDAIDFLYTFLHVHTVKEWKNLEEKPIEIEGIAQGCSLSCLLMTVVVAKIMNVLQRKYDMEFYSYIDDIYILCTDRETAKQIYDDFSVILAHFKGGQPHPLRCKNPTAKKYSEILDLQKKPMTILKTFRVSKKKITISRYKYADIAKEYAQKKEEHGWDVRTFWKKSTFKFMPFTVCKKILTQAEKML